MCSVQDLEFVRRSVSAGTVSGKRVLEVGSYAENGSARSVLSGYGPREYVGVDMRDGPGVDLVLPCSFLVDKFGVESFDIVVSTDMLEHVQDWRWAVSQMKRVTAIGGTLLVTTCSPGFPYHGYPHDFWRFTKANFAAIFADLENVKVDYDAHAAGGPCVYMVGRKPKRFVEKDLSKYDVPTCPQWRPPTLAQRAISETRAAVLSRVSEENASSVRAAKHFVVGLFKSSTRQPTLSTARVNMPYLDVSESVQT